MINELIFQCFLYVFQSFALILYWALYILIST